jgi:hypothetical protein
MRVIKIFFSSILLPNETVKGLFFIYFTSISYSLNIFLLHLRVNFKTGMFYVEFFIR